MKAMERRAMINILKTILFSIGKEGKTKKKEEKLTQKYMEWHGTEHERWKIQVYSHRRNSNRIRAVMNSEIPYHYSLLRDVWNRKWNRLFTNGFSWQQRRFLYSVVISTWSFLLFSRCLHMRTEIRISFGETKGEIRRRKRVQRRFFDRN